MHTLADFARSGAVLFVDKAEGWTSHDVVARTRRVMGTRKVGHAGTLDPLATGLLTLGVGPATRLLTHLVGLDKVYTATIRLGQKTTTDDCEGEIVSVASVEMLAAVLADPHLINAAAGELTGQIAQIPTAVSAIKVNGKRAYELVRAGKEVELKARQVTVHRFELGTARWVETEHGPAIDIDCAVSVSSGTYVRALARDLGEKLGTYGHLTKLRRESVGPFNVGDALPLAQLEEQAQLVTAGGAAQLEAINPVSPATVAASLFGSIAVDETAEIALGHGKQLRCHAADTKLSAAIGASGRLVALVQVCNGQMRVVTGFPN